MSNIDKTLHIYIRTSMKVDDDISLLPQYISGLEMSQRLNLKPKFYFDNGDKDQNNFKILV